jgi:hypothetical protein
MGIENWLGRVSRVIRLDQDLESLSLVGVRRWRDCSQRNTVTTERRIQDGEIQDGSTNPSTIRKWLRSWKDGGLKALIDGRSLRARKCWELIDPRYRKLAEEVLDTLDGDKSTVSVKELDPGFVFGSTISASKAQGRRCGSPASICRR